MKNGVHCRLRLKLIKNHNLSANFYGVLMIVATHETFVDNHGMCLSIPGKIIRIKKDQQATADFGGIEKDINVSLVKVKIGDYVMVHAGFAIEKMESAHADSINKLIKNG